MKCNSEYRLLGIPFSWIVLILFDAGLIVMVMAQNERPGAYAAQPAGNTYPTAVTQLEVPGGTDPDDVRFAAIDVFVDSGNTPLAAWQFELQSRLPGVEIVGIEGGDHAAYVEPPYYDPRAMNHNRVIVAAFSTADELPAGRSRIARIHVQLRGPEIPEFESRLDVCATTDGQAIPATMTLAKAVL